MSYDYRESMKCAVLDYLEENGYKCSDFWNRDELEQKLNDDLWIEDSVTGNGSGSYTFDRETAKEYVVDNTDLLGEMIEEFCISAETIKDKMIEEDWEYFDVSIRCYLLGQAISEALDEFESEENPYQVDMDNEDEEEEE